MEPKRNKLKVLELVEIMIVIAVKFKGTIRL